MKCILVPILLLSTQSFAFESVVHGDITAKAFVVLQKCGVSDLILQASSGVSKGSVDEDTTQPLVRARNWHFYNTYGNLRQGPIFYESLDHIFKIRNENLQNLENHNESYENSLGRMLHYIQDVFVPAHVVPVFHGSPISEKDDDAFDHYKLSESEKLAAIADIPCSDLNVVKAETHQDIATINQQILDSSAQYTTSKMRTRIDGSSATWGYFWREPKTKTFDLFDTLSELIVLGKKSARFGTYVGNFGQDTIVTDYLNQKVEINTAAYKDFYTSQYREAVHTSARVILINYSSKKESK